MMYVHMRANVADYQTWRPVFDSMEEVRRANGGKGVNRIFRDAENPNTITLLMEWDNAENARKFIGSPALKDAMQRAGVLGAPLVLTVLTGD